MDDQAPHPGVLEDIAGLAAEGIDETSLAKRRHLVSAIVEALGADVVDGEHQVHLLRDVLVRVIDEQQQLACNGVHEIRSHNKCAKIPRFQVAAAGEFIGLTNEELFDQVKAYRLEWAEDSWDDLTAKDDNSGDTAYRQLRAAIWLGSKSARTGARYQSAVFTALEEAIRGHLASPDTRAELVAKYVMRPKESHPVPASHNFPEISDPNLKKAVDRLRADVLDEVRAWRQRQSPEDDFLPVSWITAEQSKYFGYWKHIRGDGSDEPIQLAGSFEDIGAIFKSIPSRRLVILGKGGAGKTVLVYELAWQLINTRLEGEPVPVIFTVATWDPQANSLRAWMVDELQNRYQPAGAKSGEDGWPIRLLKSGLILPVLDGFDEIPPELRADAFKSLDDDGVPQFVITSRPDEFLEAASNAERRLARTPAVELVDLSLDQIEDYLRFGTLPTNASDEDSSRWDVALERMRAASRDDQGRRVLEVLSLPLMVFLARSIYRSSHADPQELLDSGSFPDAASVRSHLLDEYIPAMYAKLSAGRKSKWDGSREAQRWLGFLALCNVEQKSKSFAWWKPSRLMDTAIEKPMYYILATSPLLLVLGTAATIAGLGLRDSNVNMSDLLVNVASPALLGIGFLAMFSLLSFGPRFRPRTFVWWNASVRSRAGGTRFPSWRPFSIRELQYRKSDGVSIGLFCFFSYLAATAIHRNPLAGLVVALFAITPIVYSPRALSANSTPHALLRADLVASISKGVGFVIGTGVVSAALWLTGRSVSPWIFVVCFSILWFGTIQSASGAWSVRRLGLAGRGYLPWRCMQFFDDAYERGILRLSGGTYQFRHAFIQNHLAKQYVGSFPDVDWPSKLFAADFMAGEADSYETVARLRSLIEDYRRSNEKQRAADVWQSLIDILREEGRRDEALHEVHSMMESELATVRAVAYSCHRTLITVLKEKGDTEGAKKELKALYGRLAKDERKISPSVTGPARSFRAELNDAPDLDDLR